MGKKMWGITLPEAGISPCGSVETGKRQDAGPAFRGGGSGAFGETQISEKKGRRGRNEASVSYADHAHSSYVPDPASGSERFRGNLEIRFYIERMGKIMKNKIRKILADNSGMGTVEIILIIVDILTI